MTTACRSPDPCPCLCNPEPSCCALNWSASTTQMPRPGKRKRWQAPDLSQSAPRKPAGASRLPREEHIRLARCGPHVPATCSQRRDPQAIGIERTASARSASLWYYHGEKRKAPSGEKGPCASTGAQVPAVSAPATWKSLRLQIFSLQIRCACFCDRVMRNLDWETHVRRSACSGCPVLLQVTGAPKTDT